MKNKYEGEWEMNKEYMMSCGKDAEQMHMAILISVRKENFICIHLLQAVSI